MAVLGMTGLRGSFMAALRGLGRPVGVAAVALAWVWAAMICANWTCC